MEHFSYLTKVSKAALTQNRTFPQYELLLSSIMAERVETESDGNADTTAVSPVTSGHREASTSSSTSPQTSPSTISNVVRIAFYNVKYTNERNYPYSKSGAGPVLQIEVLGDRHSLDDIGHMLFDHYLEEVLDESLYDHIWRYVYLYYLLSVPAFI